MTDSLGAPVSDLRRARLRRGLSQRQVADRIGTTQSAIARMEAGLSDPRLSTVQRYLAAVGATVAVVAAHPSLERTAVVVRAALRRSDPDEALRHVLQLLDDLRGLSPELRAEAVRQEPMTVGDDRWDALLGGVAEYASEIWRFPVPGWASAPGRFLRRFWFVIEDILGRPAAGLAVSSFVRSPAALASRGVFLDRDSLAGV